MHTSFLESSLSGNLSHTKKYGMDIFLPLANSKAYTMCYYRICSNILPKQWQSQRIPEANCIMTC